MASPSASTSAAPTSPITVGVGRPAARWEPVDIVTTPASRAPAVVVAGKRRAVRPVEIAPLVGAQKPSDRLGGGTITALHRRRAGTTSTAPPAAASCSRPPACHLQGVGTVIIPLVRVAVSMTSAIAHWRAEGS